MDIIANEDINYKELRVIDPSNPNNKSVLMDTTDALIVAKQANLDLVVIAPDANPPVAKFTDLQKHIYEQKKRDKDQRKKTRESATVLKEVYIRPVTGDNDLKIKGRQIKKFIESNAQVRIGVKYRGREMAQIKNAKLILDKLLAEVGEYREINKLSVSGNRASMQIAKAK